ncbi:MAG TPA: hypothetical protein VGJ32_16500 [Solirubrobacteraceae bacterium]|jgi:hypothetical protein
MTETHVNAIHANEWEACRRPVAERPAGDLHPDDRAVFDPLFGGERVLHAEDYTLPNGVEVVHLHVAGDEGDRFIVRAAHEHVPVLS